MAEEVKYVTITLQHPEMGEEPYEVTLPEDQTVPQEVAYHYIPHLNPAGAGYPGVPLGDVTVAQLKELPGYTKKALAKDPAYMPHDDWVAALPKKQREAVAPADADAPARPKTEQGGAK
jgi:hypothetical protein